jgi:MFS family permease
MTNSIGIVFLFHTSNGTVLPLVMQTLAIGSGRGGMLMSGLCIIVAQIFMVASAKICGEFSGKYGRKTLFLIGLFVVPVRCLILTGLLILRGDGVGSPFMQFLILSTQVLDGVGAGVFGTMYILVTSDISGGTGRFSMTLGLTTAAMSIGGTVSGYLGEALAEDIGYKEAFFILAIMSLVPALLYLLFMPETLPDLVTKNDPLKLGGIQRIQEEPEESDKPYASLT